MSSSKFCERGQLNRRLLLLRIANDAATRCDMSLLCRFFVSRAYVSDSPPLAKQRSSSQTTKHNAPASGTHHLFVGYKRMMMKMLVWDHAESSHESFRRLDQPVQQLELKTSTANNSCCRCRLTNTNSNQIQLLGGQTLRNRPPESAFSRKY